LRRPMENQHCRDLRPSATMEQTQRRKDAEETARESFGPRSHADWGAPGFCTFALPSVKISAVRENFAGRLRSCSAPLLRRFRKGAKALEGGSSKLVWIPVAPASHHLRPASESARALAHYRNASAAPIVHRLRCCVFNA
jgi:hypothetical protein